MNISSILQGESSGWIRFSSYEIKKGNDRKPIITPSKDAKFEIYDPMEHADEILVDALQIGIAAMDKKTIKDVPGLVLGYVNRFGLLGIMSDLLIDKGVLGNDSVRLRKNIFTEKESMPIDNYLNCFLPLAMKKQSLNRSVGGTTYTFPDGVDTEQQMELVYFLANRPQVLEFICSIHYSEPLDWIVTFFKYLYHHFYCCSIYNECDNPEYRESLALAITQLKTRGLSGSIKQEESQWIMSWELDSLLIAIETFYGLYLTSEETRLKMCKHCLTAFIATNPKMEFCSPACRNQYNVYKSRAKQKEEMENNI